MAADDKPVLQDRPAKQGSLGKILSFFFRIIGILLFSAVISVLIEWGGMYFIYPDKGFEHAEGMMFKEVEYITGIDQDEIQARIDVGNFNKGSVKKAQNVIEDISFYFLGENGVIKGLRDYVVIHEENSDIIKALKRFLLDIYDYLVAAIYIIVMFCIRLAILFLSLPVFILFGFVGLSDGLMQRDLRRWCGGNESAFIYHWAKRFAFPVLVVGWIIYLAIPTSVHPNFIITPFAVLFGLVIMIMASKFKKYL